MLFALTTCRVFPERGSIFYRRRLGRQETLQLGFFNKDGFMRKLGLIQTAILLVFIGIHSSPWG